MIKRISHLCPCVIVFIQLAAKRLNAEQGSHFIIFPQRALINKKKHEYSCKILFIDIHV